MPYCTQSDVTARIPSLALAQLTNDTANATTVDPTVLSALIAAADAEIDMVIADRYSVPFVGAPPRIRDLSVTITIYHAQARRFGVMNVAKDWKDAYTAALTELKGYASGDRGLPGVVAGTSDDAKMQAPTRLMNFEDADSPVSLF